MNKKDEYMMFMEHAIEKLKETSFENFTFEYGKTETESDLFVTPGEEEVKTSLMFFCKKEGYVFVNTFYKITDYHINIKISVPSKDIGNNLNEDYYYTNQFQRIWLEGNKKDIQLVFRVLEDAAKTYSQTNKEIRMMSLFQSIQFSYDGFLMRLWKKDHDFA